MTVPYKDILLALAKSKVRYLVAGGFAVNFHNYNRSTADLDLIIHLEPKNAEIFDAMMTDLGYRPRVPVSGKDLGDESKRREWIMEKNMVVFTYINPNNPMEIIDIFVEEPKPFEEMYKDRLVSDVFDVKINVVGYDDLVEMKKKAGRPKDQIDLLELEKRNGK
jgi:hypothetical protein